MFAKSMQEMDREIHERQQPSFPLQSIVGGHTRGAEVSNESMDLHSKKHSPRRQSLPMDRSENIPLLGQKRKRVIDEQNPPEGSHLHGIAQNTRFNAMGSDLRSLNDDQFSQSSRLLCGKGCLLAPARSTHGEIHRVRDIIATKPTDTTRTDYFRLKALGLDPDTSVTPRARSPLSTDSDENSRSKPPGLFNPLRNEIESVTANHASDTFQASAMPNTLTRDSDEELFMRMRQVKNAMADGISWYKKECASNAQGNHERHHHTGRSTRKRPNALEATPSRTMKRIRAIGAQSSRRLTYKALKPLGRQKSLRNCFSIQRMESYKLRRRTNKDCHSLSPSVSSNGISAVTSLDDSNFLGTPREYVNGSGQDYDPAQPLEIPQPNKVSRSLGYGFMKATGNNEEFHEVLNERSIQYPDFEQSSGVLLVEAPGESDCQESMSNEEDNDDERDDSCDGDQDQDCQEEEETEESDDCIRGGDEGYEEEFSDDGMDSEVSSTVWKSNGELKGATAEDAIEL